LSAEEHFWESGSGGKDGAFERFHGFLSDLVSFHSTCQEAQKHC
jgi:hypothetical protein